jgi:TolA-binding protein
MILKIQDFETNLSSNLMNMIKTKVDSLKQKVKLSKFNFDNQKDEKIREFVTNIKKKLEQQKSNLNGEVEKLESMLEMQASNSKQDILDLKCRLL